MDPVLVQHIQIVVIQQHGKKKVLGVPAVDLKDHDPLLVLAEYGGIDLIIGGKSYLGSIQLHGLPDGLGHGIHLDGRTVNNALVLVFIDHIEIIRISYKVNIDVFIRHKGQGDPFHQFHAPIVHADGVVRVVILENQEVTIELTNDLEVGAPAVFPLRLGVNDLLGRQQTRGKQDRKQ